MRPISEYLIKFQNIGIGVYKYQKTAIEEALFEILGAKKGDFELKDNGGGYFVIKCSPSLKNEIAIRKAEILSIVKNKTNSNISLK